MVMSIPIPKRYMLLIAAFLALAALSMVISPLTIPEGTVQGLDGNVGRLDNWEELQDVPWPQRLVYLIGDVNCHQQADRSFELNGNQLPFCSRDLGLVMGASLGMAAFAIRGRRAHWMMLGLLLIPMALDGGLQALTSYESDNLVRVTTGALAGSAIGWGGGALIGDFFARKNPSRPEDAGTGHK
jgi:uncharacterized membrane protein